MADMTNPMSDAEKLAQVMSGNLQGTLSSGDRLVALSQLMRSLTRSGRAAGLTPGGVVQNIQQQKAAELQNRLQIEQLRQQSAQRAKLQALREGVTATLPPELQERARLLPDEAFTKGIQQQVFPETYAPTEEMKVAAQLFPVGSDAYKAYLAAQAGVGKTIATPQGIVNVPGVSIDRKVVEKDGRQIRVAIINGVPYSMD